MSWNQPSQFISGLPTSAISFSIILQVSLTFSIPISLYGVSEATVFHGYATDEHPSFTHRLRHAGWGIGNFVFSRTIVQGHHTRWYLPFSYFWTALTHRNTFCNYGSRPSHHTGWYHHFNHCRTSLTHQNTFYNYGSGPGHHTGWHLPFQQFLNSLYPLKHIL